MTAADAVQEALAKLGPNVGRAEVLAQVRKANPRAPWSKRTLENVYQLAKARNCNPGLNGVSSTAMPSQQPTSSIDEAITLMQKLKGICDQYGKENVNKILGIL